MFIWEPQAQRIVSCVARETSVEVVGPRFSGRSTVLQGVGETLTTIGYKVVQVRALRSASGLEALCSALPATAQKRLGPTATPWQVTAAFHDLVADTRAVIIVDDADRLDDASWTILESLNRNDGVPLVVSTIPPARVPNDRRLPNRVARIAREDLEPLPADIFHRLAESRIGEPLCPGLTARLNTISAGLPGLALANLESAVARGRIRKLHNYWSAIGDLWTPDIADLFESLVLEHPPTIRDAVEAIALTGTATLETAGGLVGQRTLEKLSDVGLVEVQVDDDIPLVTVTPPGLETYYRAQVPTVRTARFRLPVDPTGQTATHGRQILDMPTINIPVLEFALPGKHRCAVSKARSDWVRHPDASTAEHYVRLLLSATRDDKTVAEVVSMPLVDDGDHESEALLRYAQTRWSLQRGEDDKSARAPLAELAARVSSVGASALFLLLVDWEFKGIERDYRERIDELTTPDRFTQQVALLALAWAQVLSGHAEAALTSLDAADPAEYGPLRQHMEYCSGFALVAAGRFHDALIHARAVSRRATVSGNLSSLAAAAWTEAAASFCLGEFADVHRAAAPALASCAAGSALPFGSDRALRILVAMSAVRLNQHSLATVLADQAARMPVETTALPFTTVAWLDAITRYQEGDHEAARGIFEEIEAECRPRGYHFAAESAAFAACLAGFAPAAGHIFRERARALGGTVFRLFIDIRLARASHDGERLYELAGQLHRLGATHEAFRFLADAKRIFRQNGDTSRVHDTVETAHTLASGAAGPSQTAIPEGLTSHFTRREHDIIDGIARGESNAEIAKALFVSVRTVESHIRNIRRKASVTDRQQLGRLQATAPSDQQRRLRRP